MNPKIKQLAENSRPVVATPQEYHDALFNDYDPGDGDFTVTQLLRPPQRTHLVAKHGAPDEEAERVWPAFLGSCLHDRMDMTAKFKEGGFSENRLYIEINGLRISGQLDRYDHNQGGIVSDYKLLTGHQFHAKPDHVAQIQMNGLLAQENGFPVKYVRLLYADKTWSITRSLRDADYPGTPWSSFVFDFDEKLARDVMTERSSEHAAALAGNPRPCTKDEMWQDDDKWAVKGKNAKRARKLCDSLSEAEEIKKPAEVIEHRPAEKTFCLFFCGYKDKCSQFNA